MPFIAKPEHASNLRKAAEKMEKQLEHKRRPAFEGLRATPRRARIAAAKAAEARTLEHVYTVLLKLAEGHANGGVPEPLALITGQNVVAGLVATLERLERDRQDATTYRDTSYVKPVRYYYRLFGNQDAYAKAGITDEEIFEAAVAALQTLLETDLQAAQRKAQLETLERNLIGGKLPGFFPTPSPLAKRLVDLADIRAGHRVLEPSAGSGHIAQELRGTGLTITLHVIERQHRLRELLELKGLKSWARTFSNTKTLMTAS
jgi:hypothetical protein